VETTGRMWGSASRPPGSCGFVISGCHVWPSILFLLRLHHATTNPNRPKAESKQQTTREDTGRREEDRDPRPRQRHHATPSPLLRTASRYKQISPHAAPTALLLRRSPGWFLLFALLLSARLSCSWCSMDAGRAPTFSWLYWFFYIAKMKSPTAAGRIMERGVLGSRCTGAVQILGTKTGATTWVPLGPFSSCHFFLWSAPVRSGIVPWD
jgi:hypothetical protein